MNDSHSATPWHPLALPGAWSADIRTHAGDQSFRVLVSRPDGPPPAGGFPVHYVLDGSDLFVSVAEVLRRAGRRRESTGIGPALLVGVDQADSEPNRNRARRHAYTAGPAAEAGLAGAGGGAPELLAFLCEQLLPMVEADVDVNPARRGLFGHSMAGYFCLWALLRRPQAFSHYAAISPSIWWNPETLRQCLSGPDLAAAAPAVYLAHGQWEGQPAPWQQQLAADPESLERRRQRDMPGHLHAFAELLGTGLPAKALQLECLPGEDHASVLGPAIPRALRFMQGR